MADVYENLIDCQLRRTDDEIVIWLHVLCLHSLINKHFVWIFFLLKHLFILFFGSHTLRFAPPRRVTSEARNNFNAENVREFFRFIFESIEFLHARMPNVRATKRKKRM